MSYLLQTEENKEKHPRHAGSGDVVVSDDFRAVYRIAPDGSRRRLKDPEGVAQYVGTVKKHLEEKAVQDAKDAEQSDELKTSLQTGDRTKLASTLALLLAGGGMLGVSPSGGGLLGIPPFGPNLRRSMRSGR